MNYIIDNTTLDFIWSALSEEAKRPRLQQAIRYFKSIIEKGWAFRSDMEDLIDCLDSRLETFRFDVVKFSKALDIHWEPVCFRPKTRSNSVMEYDAIRAEDAAVFLILLERIGFQTDPTEFVKLLLPTIKSRKKKLFSNAELELFWFNKTRHKHAEITLKIERDVAYDEAIKSTKTNSGYLIKLKGDKKGNPTMLKITAPKYRDRGRPVQTTCPECCLEWYKGDPDSSFIHRREHKVIMAYLDPKPSTEMLEERKTADQPELVTAGSPEWKQNEMYLRARAFKREFGFDFIQWKSPNSVGDANVYGFLFTNIEGAIVGACAFRDRTEDYSSIVYGLQWIWVCPKERRNGHLDFRWKMFRRCFGDFIVESPVSDTMKAFLEKKGDSALMNYPIKKI